VTRVILNRFEAKYMGATITAVCLRPWQFSCWNEKDPNSRIVKEVTLASPAFRVCLRAALNALDAHFTSKPDPTRGSKHYCVKDMLIMPSWARGHMPAAEIGSHAFFNDVK
jgi:N-acetylmuramoyl-L-alanine amidase